IAGFDRSIPFAGAAVALAGLFAVATEALSRRSGEPSSEAASAIFATGSIASLALALSLGLEKGWLTVALALMVPGIAWVAEQRPLPALRWLAAAVTFGVLGRIAWDPHIVGDKVAPHLSSIGCSMVTAYRRHRSGLPDPCCAAVLTTRRLASSTPQPPSSPCFSS